ncbi:MAG: calcium-binding protein [Longimicrobiales bacterium]
MRRTSTPASPKAKLRKSRSTSRLDALIEEATVDAYDESEQKAGFFTMLENHLAVPFSTEVLGMTVTVETIDMTDDEEIVAVCVRGKSRQPIRILELPLPEPRPEGAEWIDAYRRWARRT